MAEILRGNERMLGLARRAMGEVRMTTEGGEVSVTTPFAERWTIG